MISSAWRTGSARALALALALGCMPCELRSNSGSSSAMRNWASALLTVGCERLSLWAALDMLRSL